MEISSVNGYDVAFCDAFTDTKADKMTKATHQFATDKLAAISTQWDPRVKAGTIPSGVVSQSSFIDMGNDLVLERIDTRVRGDIDISFGGPGGAQVDITIAGSVKDDKGNQIDLKVVQEMNQEGLGETRIKGSFSYGDSNNNEGYDNDGGLSNDDRSCDNLYDQINDS